MYATRVARNFHAFASYCSISAMFMNRLGISVSVVRSSLGKGIWTGMYSSHASERVRKNTCRAGASAHPYIALSLCTSKGYSPSGSKHRGSHCLPRQHEAFFPSSEGSYSKNIKAPDPLSKPLLSHFVRTRAGGSGSGRVGEICLEHVIYLLLTLCVKTS